MVFTSLQHLDPYDRNAVVQVQVSRKWEFRGGKDSGPLQHIDMVLVDHEGNAVYAEIPAEEANEKGSLIQQNGIYIISRFKVTNAKTFYRPVAGEMMIKFTCYTKIAPATNPPSTFPKYIYRLTPFDQIDSFVNDSKDFLETRNVQFRVQAEPTVARDIVIKDLGDLDIKITLWGQRALEFCIEDIYDKEKSNPVVVLFVGCLARSFQGTYLSGGAACTWYFNPDIKEAQEYYSSLQSQKIQLQLPTTHNQQLIANVPPAREQKTLRELLELTPYDIQELKGCECTVTITGVPEDQVWWYPACARCPQKTTTTSTGFQCPKCGREDVKFRYKLNFVASDGTAIAKMFCFDTIARHIVGKSCDSLVKFTSGSSKIPPDLAAIVSLKFAFVVTTTNRSFDVPEKVFQIESIVAAYGRQQSLPQISQGTQQEPATPPKISTTSYLQDSPSTAIQRLSTNTPVKVARSLVYSPAEPGTSTLHSQSNTSTDDPKEKETTAEKNPLHSPPKRFKYQPKNSEDADTTQE